MAQKRYKVTLTKDEEATLHAVINKRFENTHSIASLYETFPVDEAKRIKDGDTLYPKHGSGPNMAEIELNVINNQGLSARIATYRADEERNGGVEPATQRGSV
jgi:hypothetical protein